MRRSSPRFDVPGQLPTLRRYALTLTRDDGDAEDLVQDALVRAYARRATFDESRSLRAWLLSILHNAFIDGVRSRRAELLRIAHAAQVAEPHEAPGQDHAVRLSQVREAFASLPDDQRAALHLVAVEGLSYAEAAVVLDAPAGTVMSRLARARESLRKLEAQEPARRTQHLRVVGGANDLDR